LVPFILFVFALLSKKNKKSTISFLFVFVSILFL
jgi:hypothetical protein